MRRTLKKIVAVLFIMILTGNLLSGCGSLTKSAKYDGNHMTFSYDKEMLVTTYHSTDEVKNTTVADSDSSFCAANVIYKAKDMKSDAFFNSIYDTYSYAEELETGELVIGKSNDGNGSKAYKEYTIKDGDYDYKIIAQLQSFDDSYFIASIVIIYELNKTNDARAKEILDSITYSETEESGGLLDTPDEYRLPLVVLESYLVLEQEMDLDTGDSNDYDEMMDEIEADTSYKALDEYEYLKTRDLASYEGNVYEVMVPESEMSDDKTSYYYNDHGIDISMYVMEMYEKDMNELIDNNDYRFDTYNENKKDYSNVEESDYLEEGKTVYKTCTADYVNYDSSVSQVATVICAIPKDDKDILFVTFNMQEKYMDAESVKILEELESAYQIPLSQYAIDESKLTFSGKASDSTIENYVYDGRGEEVFAVEDFELLGKTKLVYDMDSVGVELLVPMGSRTYVSGSYASGSMHGVDTTIRFSKTYGDFDLLEETVSDVEYNRAYILENTRDYSNVSEISLAKDSTETAALGSFTYEKILDDGSAYEMQEILIKIYTDDDLQYYTEIELTLNQADFDSRTELLLQEISTAYGIDYLKLTDIALNKATL